MFGEYPVTKILGSLSRDNLLPTILFRTARKQCDGDVERLSEAKNGKLPPDQQRVLVDEVEQIMQRYTIERDVILKHPQYRALVETGVGAHHAGQLLVWRLVLEELMSKGLLRMMIATGTVAAGVDFPARSVVVTAHSKRGGEGFNVLSSSEFQQMSGRAGRRGKDAVGICVIAPGMYSDARVLHEVAQRPPEPLRSAYFAAPATVLNLLKYRNVDDLKFTVSKSLAAFLDRKSAKGLKKDAEAESAHLEIASGFTGEAKRKAEKRIRRKIRDAEALEGRQLEQLERTLGGLTKLGYVEANGGLTEKGSWAANLCTSLVLELGEAIAEHLFEDLSEQILVGIVASIAGDPHRSYFSLKANPVPKELFARMQKIVDRVGQCYEEQAEVAVLPDASLTVISWIDAANWGEFSALLRLAGAAEGDVARLVMQTADHLNQIARLRETHPELAAMAARGRELILKPPLTEPATSD